MRLVVRVIEARNIPAMDPNGFSDPYVKLQLGKQKFRTKVVKKCLNPSWGEEFTFKVEDLKDELVVSVLDEDKYSIDDFVGQIRVPVHQVFDANDTSLGTNWYALQRKNKKTKNRDCGEILLNIYFSQSSAFSENQNSSDQVPQSKKFADTISESSSRSSNGSLRPPSPIRSEVPSSVDEKCHAHTLANRIAQIFNKNVETVTSSSGKAPESSGFPGNASPEAYENKSDEDSSAGNFEELMKNMESRDGGSEISSNLPGGVLLDQLYATSPSELNSLLFSPDSNFLKSLADFQASAELQIGSWKFENGSDNLKRVVTFIKAPSRLVKALRTTEEQTYLKADGKSFAVLVVVLTPDAPYGSTFRTEVLFCITSGPELPSGELSSRLVISWRLNFVQSTMMKGMIESGARQGIKESFMQYASLLSQNVKTVDLKDVASEKEQVLASLQVEPQSDAKLALQYFANFTVVSTIFMGLYLLVHVWLAMPSTIQGLEFPGLDLPDSIGEVIVCSVLALQGKRVLEFISRFMQARVQKGSDHGVKAQGEGWLLTVALLEGNNLAAIDSSGFSDPYVVFTCNGKTRTSSIKFQKSDPLWNEIFEFDAMDEPPSMLHVDVYNFDGPFDEAMSLGSAEINFVKSNMSDLADVWVPLQGKLAQACQSKLHLRIFLDNTRSGNVVKDYLNKMEKEVGRKIKLRSPQTNSAFQKLFKLPPEEFLINDFTCHLKRKMPLQGRLFLSARIIGFHADLFGHKTTFFFLWEDIEEIVVVPPTLSSMGSPIIVMTLRPSRGLDARHGAKTQDEEGRLKFHFHSFVSFSVAQRTIMALWKARALTPEQNVELVEEESEGKGLQVFEESAAKSQQVAELGSKSQLQVVEPGEKSQQVSESGIKHQQVSTESGAKGHQILEESVAKNFQLVEDEPEGRTLETNGNGSYLGFEDVGMSIVYSSVVSVPSSYFMELFGGNELDRRIMERAGCVNYSYSPWESKKSDVYQRQIYYKFDEHISSNRGEVTSTQQKSHLPDKRGWLIEEVTSLHGYPLGDYFNLHLRYQVEDVPTRSMASTVQVFFGIAWLKSSKNRRKMTKNILSRLQERLKLIFGILEKEFVSGK